MRLTDRLREWRWRRKLARAQRLCEEIARGMKGRGATRQVRRSTFRRIGKRLVTKGGRG